MWDLIRLAVFKGDSTMTGGASRKPRLVGGVRARNHVWFFPCREAPLCGRGASHWRGRFRCSRDCSFRRPCQ